MFYSKYSISKILVILSLLSYIYSKYSTFSFVFKDFHDPSPNKITPSPP